MVGLLSTHHARLHTKFRIVSQELERLQRSGPRLDCTPPANARSDLLYGLSHCRRSKPEYGPNTTTMLEFRTLEEARKAAASAHLKAVLEGIRSTGVHHLKLLLVERSPFTPEPLRP